MNGDNQLHLGVICRHSVQEADVWFGLYVWEMCTGLWIGSAHLPAALGRPARHAVAVGASYKGFFCAPGLIFGHVDRRRMVI